MTPEQLASVAEEVRSIVDRAADIVREHWNKPRRINYKGRIDLVTETDVAVETFLKEALAPLVPGATILAEESSGREPLGELTWVVDPVDGTTNFAHGHPYTAISVALCRKGVPVLGVVANAVTREEFRAVRGQGAFFNDSPMRTTATDDMAKALVASGFPYAIEEYIDTVLASLRAVLLRCQGVRRCGAAALDLAYLAAGRVDAFYEATLMPWDTAAGWLLVEEAGGRVSRMDGGPFDLRAPAVLASNGPLHEQMLELVGPYWT